MKWLSAWWRWCAITCLLVVTACGGGGGSGEAPPPVTNELLARVNAPLSTMVGQWLTLDGSSSSVGTYAWRVVQRPAGSTASLDAAQSTVASPSLKLDVVGDYVFGLTVSAGSSKSAEALVTVKGTISLVTQAEAAKLSAFVDLNAQSVVLAWTDTLPAGGSYRVQSLDANKKVVSTLADVQAGTGASLQWSGPIAGASGWQVLAIFGGTTYPLSSATQPAAVLIPLTPGPTSIEVDGAQPFSWADGRKLQIKNFGGYDQYVWYVDLHKVWFGAMDVGTSMQASQLQTNDYDPYATDGAHALWVRMTLGGYLTVDLRSSIQLSSLSATLQLNKDGWFTPVADPIDPGAFNVVASATSAKGIKSIEAIADGVSLGTLTDKNWKACPPCVTNDLYGWSLTLKAGDHSLQVRATDGAGRVFVASRSYHVSQQPVITRDSPKDGTVGASFNLTGHVTADSSAAIEVVARLQDLEVFRGNSADFSNTIDLSGVANGTYTLLVSATAGGRPAVAVARQLIISK